MSFRLADIARLIGSDVPDGLADIEIRAVNSIESASEGDITFLSNPKYTRYLATTRASAVIIAKNTVTPLTVAVLVVEDPYFAFLKILQLFNTRSPSDIADGIDQNASIHPDARLGKNVSVGPSACIGSGVSIGDGTKIGACTVILRDVSIGTNCLIYPNVTITDGCEIGNNIIIHAGAVIGSDGFGFVPHEGKILKIPQIGTVRIEDDVEIQAGTCIDRAAFGVTVVSKGAKIDNLVQVGHNVRIGSSTVIAAQTGISGSTTIGRGVRIGGQAGLAGHLTVGDGASVGAQAGVTKDVRSGDTVSGYPARTHAHELRLEASLERVPELLKEVKRQEKRIRELEEIVELMKQSNE